MTKPDGPKSLKFDTLLPHQAEVLEEVGVRKAIIGLLAMHFGWGDHHSDLENLEHLRLELENVLETSRQPPPPVSGRVGVMSAGQVGEAHGPPAPYTIEERLLEVQDVCDRYDEMNMRDVFRARSGRVYRWTKTPTGQKAWVRDCDGMQVLAMAHPEGLDGIDRDLPPEPKGTARND